jgi:hypothetical protein
MPLLQLKTPMHRVQHIRQDEGNLRLLLIQIDRKLLRLGCGGKSGQD